MDKNINVYPKWMKFDPKTFQPFGWVKKTNSDPYIGNTYTLVQHISDRVDYIGYFAEYTFADGTPFGIKED